MTRIAPKPPDLSRELPPHLHPLQRRWYAEDLVRLRRSDESRRFAAPQRAGRVDPNPHQIEAVIFALSRIGEGGCILADEVGLGKTIEAGLVIAQLRAEGARRILLVVPKPLVGQWRQELFQLFAIEARDEWPSPTAFEGEGVFLAGREAAGSERGQHALLSAAPFDLIVVDEAHEVFSGLHRRFDASGAMKTDAPSAQTAGRLFDVIHASQTPVLLLTATPIQNNLKELWALVRYVDPQGTLLGDIQTFRRTFCDDDDRTVAEGQTTELKRRIDVVLKRTLRRQAQEFLSRPFVARQARLYTYAMSPDERALYEDVTRYLLEPNLEAFAGNQRRLLLIGFHRLMASSTAALASSLRRVAQRLRRTLDGRMGDDAGDTKALVEDLEDDDLLELGEDAALLAAPNADKVRAELQRVEDFVARAEKLKDDGKSRALLKAVKLVLDRGRTGKGSGKVVVFTESLVTQAYLRDILVASGLVTEEDLTLFSGTNEGPRARQALERWMEEEGAKQPARARASRDVAMRMALVHEFKTRSKVFVSTEAGAKGLNLQFCETVINYDLPWNPQRIEQRIGRCHRYGQERDVTVINFLAKDNEAARLMFDILSRKLDLFGMVLDASDVVLHRPGEKSPEILAGTFGAELETSLGRIWQRARTMAEVEAELRQLHDRVGDERGRIEEERARTARLIETAFDDDVRQVFVKRKEELPEALDRLDHDIERVVTAHLEAIGAAFTRMEDPGGPLLVIGPHEALPESLREGVTVAVSGSADHEPLHLGHPLVLAAVEATRTENPHPRVAVRIPADAEPELRALRGRRGRLALLKVKYEGLEPVERLLPLAVLDGDDAALPPGLGAALLLAPMRDAKPLAAVDDGAESAAPSVDADLFEDAVDEALFADRADATSADEGRFERGLEQVERFVEDRLLLRRRERAELERRIDDARGKRDAALSLDVRGEAESALKKLEEASEEIDKEVDRLERRDDDTYRRCRERLLARRYAPPAVTRLFEAEITVE